MNYKEGASLIRIILIIALLVWQPFVQEFLTGDWINQIQNPGDLN
jgi:hypothetical protein